MQHVQMHLSQKEKYFSQFSCAFSESKLNLEYFQKKITFIPYVFPSLRTPKDVVR